MKENKWEKDVVVPVCIIVDQEAEIRQDPGLWYNHRISSDLFPPAEPHLPMFQKIIKQSQQLGTKYSKLENIVISLESKYNTIF